MMESLRHSREAEVLAKQADEVAKRRSRDEQHEVRPALQSHRHIHEPPRLSKPHPPKSPRRPSATVLQYRMAARETAVPHAPAQAEAG